jgi:hypothetical protein
MEAAASERETTMKMKTLRVVALFLGLLLFGASNGTRALELIIQQIQQIGPWQWVRLMAGAMASKIPIGFQIASFG